jgi:hypothetical protein
MLIDRKTVKQFKLVTGEDLICEILDDEGEEELFVRNAFKLVNIERDDTQYTVFKPFMMFQEEPTQVVLLNTSKIVAAAVPFKPLFDQYCTALESFQEEFENIELEVSDTMSEEELNEHYEEVETKKVSIH